MKTALVSVILFTEFGLALGAEANKLSANSVDPRETRWRDDLECFERELPARHLEFFKIVPKEHFARDIDDLRSDLSRLSDVEVNQTFLRRSRLEISWRGVTPRWKQL